ncbi:DUF6270 domain-containing protein, partial [Brachybacterium sp. AOP42-C2-15]|uniref:DUF6270 domain-containing protein n=1 Tax=Brachybacterium sp. AOP42-C2-15 TaxID=3457670 RepID=UPI004034C025
SGVVDFGNGTYATKLSEFWGGSGGREVSRDATQIDFGTEQHLALWSAGAERLLDALRTKGLLEKTLVVRTNWATHYDTGEELEVPGWMLQPSVANEYFARYFAVLADAGVGTAELPANLAQTSRSHQWGPSPYHYRNEAYEFLADLLRRR